MNHEHQIDQGKHLHAQEMHAVKPVYAGDVAKDQSESTPREEVTSLREAMEEARTKNPLAAVHSMFWHELNYSTPYVPYLKLILKY